MKMKPMDKRLVRVLNHIVKLNQGQLDARRITEGDLRVALRRAYLAGMRRERNDLKAKSHDPFADS